MRKYVVPLTVIALLFVIFGTIYGVTQQSQRNAADYPQIQLAEDTASTLNQGVSPKLLTLGRVDMANSLAPFIVIYNKNGQVVSGSGYLNGSIPIAPFGILTAANNKEYNRVTWQPESSVRVAAITVSSAKYYVLSGRSLKVVEQNENEALYLSLLGGVISVLIVLVSYFVIKYNR